MLSVVKRLIHTAFNRFGYQIEKTTDPFANFDERAKDTIRQVLPYTMIGEERLFTLIEAVRYIARNRIGGDFVECGVWQGGAAMAMAWTAVENNISPAIWLYDSFDGMPEPGDADRDFAGKSAQQWYDEIGPGWCQAGEDDVRRNIGLVDYDADKWVIVGGLVEDTIPANIPEKIAILRLDTDWYDSTLHELNNLYDLLAEGGILIIDDYGDWQGSKKAVDEFFASRKIYPYLAPTGGQRVWVKQTIG